MTSPAHRTRVGGILVFSATAVLLFLLGFWRMFAHFPGYDDEGYILHTVRAYLQQGNLYNEVYSQYGPGFYVLLDGLQRLTGVTVDHAFARWFTLTLWLGTALVMGAVTVRATASRAMAWFAWVATFLYLHQFSEEAFHPGVVVCFGLAATMWIMLELSRRGRVGWMFFTVGAGAALLGLLKINVGVLFAAGCGLWLLFSSDKRWLGLSAGFWGVVAGVGFALALMYGLLGAAWVRAFAVIFAAGLAGLGATIRPHRSGGDRPWAALVAGAALMVIGVAAGVMLRGTSVRALWEGVILGPLRHASAYSFAVDWRPGSVVLALAALLALAAHRWLVHRGRTEAAERLLVGLRLAQILGVLVVVALLEQFRVIGVLFSYTIPWLWLWVQPLAGEPRDETGREARSLVACVLVLQTLHAYPVGGIQICWGTFPLFALVGLAVPETAAWLDRRYGAPRRIGALLCGLVLVVAGSKAALTAWTYREAYAENQDLSLPGATGLRLSPREAVTYRTMVTNSVAHADMLFSLPGMFSFNLWSELPTPTTRNTTLWYSLLPEEEQIAIIRSLERARRPALVVDRALVAILQASGAPPTGPLYVYLLTNFRPAFSLHGLGLWVKAGRTIAPIGTFRPGDDRSVEVCLLGPGEPITAMEFVAQEGRTPEPVVLEERNTRVSVQPLHPDGSPRGPALAAGWPLRFDGLARITLSGAGPGGLAPEQESLLVLRFGDGHRRHAAISVDQN